jgi:hypothetical protein
MGWLLPPLQKKKKELSHLSLLLDLPSCKKKMYDFKFWKSKSIFICKLNRMLVVKGRRKLSGPKFIV